MAHRLGQKYSRIEIHVVNRTVKEWGILLLDKLLKFGDL